MRQASWVLAVALVAAGCAAPASSGAGAPSVVQALATGKVAAAILAQPSLKRVARPFQDPAAGKPFKVSQYWDYEPGTPFEIEDAVVTSSAGSGGARKITLKADVKLPTSKALKFHLLQAEASALDEAEGAKEGAAEEEAPEVAASGVASSEGPEAEEASEGPEPAEDLAGAETDEAITPEADDVPWADDYLADADEDGVLDEGEASQYQEAFDEAAEDKILTAPHPVSMEVDDQPQMGGGTDLVRIKDEKTGSVVEIRHDQNWDRFELSSGSSKLEVLFQPDGGYLVDGQAVNGVDEAVARLQGHPLVKAAGPHAWSLLAGRLGRLPQEESRGSKPPSGCRDTSCNPGGGAYRLLLAAQDDTRRAFLLVDSLVAKLVLRP